MTDSAKPKRVAMIAAETMTKAISLILALSCGVWSVAAHALEPQSSPGISTLVRWLEQRQQDSGVIGVSAALVVDGKVVWIRGLGHADQHAGIAMTPDTLVGIGSVTKTFTALATMQLQEQGMVNIEQPLSHYLPQFHMRTHGWDLNQVTLKRLITHSSGVPTDVFRDMEADRATYTDVVNLIDQTSLAHPPGTVGLYSNAGYNLLAHALATASGTDYPELLKRRIFLPLGMTSTGFSTDQPKLPRSKAYEPDGAETAPFELRDIASGGIYSTAGDLARYAIALMDAYHGQSSAAVNEEMVRAMFSRQTDIPIDTNKKGLGWFLFRSDSGFAAYHAGSTYYSNAALVLIPEQRAAAIILANTVGSDALCEQFAFRWLESHGLAVADIVPEPVGPPASMPRVARARHAGYYAQKNGYAKVSITDDGLSIRRGADTFQAAESSPGVFVVAAAGGANGDLYYFRDIGPYHVLFWRRGAREQQQGYRIEAEPLDAAWAQRIGEYSLFGYSLPGFEKIIGAEISLQDDGLPILRITYNTGKFVYPLVPIAKDEARTGGLGPSMTGDSVSFAADAKGEVMTYLGLSFRRIQ
jgi:CubicO group peptidase (beta-lactamase class C family)